VSTPPHACAPVERAPEGAGCGGRLSAWLVTNSLPPRFSGAGLNDSRIAARLAEFGVDPVLVSRRHPGEERAGILDGVAVLRLGRMDGGFARTRWVADFLATLSRSPAPPHLVRFRGYSLPFAAAIGALRRHRPSIAVLCQPACLGEDDPATVRGKRLGGLQLRALLACDALLAMNPALGAAMAEHGMARERILPVRNAVDLERFAPVDARCRVRLRAALGLPGGPLVLTLGILDARKGQALVTRAFARVAPGSGAGTAAQLAHVGPNSRDLAALRRADRVAHARAEEQRVREAAGLVPGRVRLLGARRDPARALQAGDVFVHASVEEGEANVVNEAMACGLALVIPDSPVYAAQVPADCALRFPPGDEAGLSRALSRLLADPGLASRLGRAARAHVERSRAPRIVARDYAQALRAACTLPARAHRDGPGSRR